MNEELYEKILANPEKLERLRQSPQDSHKRLIAEFDEFHANWKKKSDPKIGETSLEKEPKKGWDSWSVNARGKALYDMYKDQIDFEEALDIARTTPRQAKEMFKMKGKWEEGFLQPWEMTKAGIGDLASLGGRGLASLPSLVRGGVEGYSESLGQTKAPEGKGLLGGALQVGEDVLRSPELPFATAGGAVASRVAPSLIARFAPKIAGPTTKAQISRKMLTDLAGQGTGAIVGKKLSGEEVGLGDVGAEVVGASLGPVGEFAGAVGSKLLKSDLADQILRGYLKPPKVLQPALEKEGTIQKLLEQDKVPFFGSAKTMEKRVDKELDDVSNELISYLDENPVENVSVLNAVEGALDENAFKASQGEISIADNVQDEIEKIYDKAERYILDPEGNIDYSKFKRFRRDLGEQAKWEKKGTSSAELPKARASQMVYNHLNEQLTKVAPEVRGFDKKLRELMLMKDVSGKAWERVGNKYLTPTGGLYGGQMGNLTANMGGQAPQVAGAMMLQSALSKPWGAKSAYKAGQAVESFAPNMRWAIPSSVRELQEQE